MMRRPRVAVLPKAHAMLAVGLLAAAAVVCAAVSGGSTKARAASPQVLRVGTWNGIPGTYSTIADAVRAAQPGDWVLVGPGDYKEQMDHASPHFDHAMGAVEITTPDLHLRGMDRNKVVIDGDEAGLAAVQLRARGPGLRRHRPQRARGRAQRRAGLEGRPGVGREPHRLQLPQRARRHRQRDLVGRR